MRSAAGMRSAAILERDARLQTHPVAARNGLPPAEVERLVTEHTEGRTLGFAGEPRVNVLRRNVALRGLVAGR
ncbi:potassium-transporting ATPase subunit C [Streptomyces sp. CO7]